MSSMNVQGDDDILSFESLSTDDGVEEKKLRVDRSLTMLLSSSSTDVSKLNASNRMEELKIEKEFNYKNNSLFSNELTSTSLFIPLESPLPFLTPTHSYEDQPHYKDIGQEECSALQPKSDIHLNSDIFHSSRISGDRFSMQNLKNEISELQSSRELALQQHQQEIEDMKKYFLSQEGRYEKELERLRDLKGTTERVSNDKTNSLQLEKKIQTLTDELAIAHLKSNDNLQEKIAEIHQLKTIAAKKDEDFDHLRTQTKELEQKNYILETANMNLQNTIINLEARIEHAMNETDRYRKESGSYKAKMEEISSTYENAIVRLSKYEQLLEQDDREIVQLRRELKEARDVTSSCRKKNDDLSEKLRSTQERLDLVTSTLQDPPRYEKLNDGFGSSLYPASSFQNPTPPPPPTHLPPPPPIVQQRLSVDYSTTNRDASLVRRHSLKEHLGLGEDSTNIQDPETLHSSISKSRSLAFVGSKPRSQMFPLEAAPTSDLVHNNVPSTNPTVKSLLSFDGLDHAQNRHQSTIEKSKTNNISVVAPFATEKQLVQKDSITTSQLERYLMHYNMEKEQLEAELQKLEQMGVKTIRARNRKCDIEDRLQIVDKEIVQLKMSLRARPA